MEFITVEQFQEQPEEVQKVFLDWWKPKKLDVFVTLDRYTYLADKYEDECIKPIYVSDMWYQKEYCIPLFTEGQLRAFIEDKKGEMVEINLYCGGYYIVTAYRKCEFDNLGKDLLQAYWKMACEIAKEG